MGQSGLQVGTELQHDSVRVKKVERLQPGFVHGFRVVRGIAAGDHIVVGHDGGTVHAFGDELVSILGNLLGGHAEGHMVHGAVSGTNIALAAADNVLHRRHTGLGWFGIVEPKERQFAAIAHVEEKVLAIAGQVKTIFQGHAQYVGIKVHRSLHVFADQCQVMKSVKFNLVLRAHGDPLVSLTRQQRYQKKSDFESWFDGYEQRSAV